MSDGDTTSSMRDCACLACRASSFSSRRSRTLASQVAVLGGPAGLALLVGMAAGVLVHQATQNVSVVQIGEFVAERATAAATEVRAMAGRYSGTFGDAPRSRTT